MSECGEKLPHSCGTRKGLQVFIHGDGSVDGFCFSCNTFVKDPYGSPKKADEVPKPEKPSDEAIQEWIEAISNYPTKDVARKKLRASVLDELGIKTGLSEEDGKTPAVLYYPYKKNGVLTGYKAKVLDGKKIFGVGKTSDVDLFNWDNAIGSGAKKLIITEGEDDCAAVISLLNKFTKQGYEEYKPAVVSLAHGASSASKDLAKISDKVNRFFKEVILCFDMDKPGQKAIEDAMQVFPYAKSVELPCKDANQCIIEGKQKAAYNAIMWNNKAPKNTRLINMKELFEEASEPPKFGELSWPWKHINDKTRGIRYGETIYIGAGVKMGKTDVEFELAAHFIKQHKIKVLLVALETSKKKTVKILAGKMVGKVFHDPKIKYDLEEYYKGCEMIGDNAEIVDAYQIAGWEALKQDIVAASNLGVKAVFIDPITNLTNGMSAADANVKLQEMAQELAAMAKDLNIVVFLFCHLRAHDGDIDRDKRMNYYRNHRFIGLGSCPHEKGGDILSPQFAGSRAMMRSCNYMIGLEGNKDEEIDENIRNIRHLVILEDREFSESGRFPIYWNRSTGVYKEA